MDFNATPSKYCFKWSSFISSATGDESIQAVNAAFQEKYSFLSPLNFGSSTHLIWLHILSGMPSRLTSVWYFWSASRYSATSPLHKSTSSSRSSKSKDSACEILKKCFVSSNINCNFSCKTLILLGEHFSYISCLMFWIRCWMTLTLLLYLMISWVLYIKVRKS